MHRKNKCFTGLVLCAALIASLTACGDSASTSKTSVDPTDLQIQNLTDIDVLYSANCNEDGSDKYVSSDLAPTICYDNLQLGYLTEAATTYKLELADEDITDVTVTAIDSEGNEIDLNSLASWDAENMVLTADQSNSSDGTITLHLFHGKKEVFDLNVAVKAAYPDDPTYDINADSVAAGDLEFIWGSNGAPGEYDENCNVHDPSITEAIINGTKYYYMVQTGWEGGNLLRRSTDLIHWENIGKTTPAADAMEAAGWTAVDDWMLKTASGCQYWAADLVQAPDGGYWLYTCIVNSAVDDEKHDRVCIVQAYSPTLEAGSFEYKGVILQSISDYAQDALYYNVVALDPQIVYSADGKMYMTYGSFGAGVYMLELDPSTGLRADGQTDWLDAETINTNMEAARNLAIGESNDYYGLHLSYCAEGSIITRQTNVEITDEDGNVTQTYDNYYYLMECLGVLRRNYVLFTAGSEDITSFTNQSGNPLASGWIGKELVTGLFPPLSGYRSDLDRESYITTADRIDGSTEFTAMSSFKWADYDFDIHAPGHGDLYTTSDGTDIAMLMVRTLALQANKTDLCDNGYELAGGSDKFMMQAHPYYINSLGQIVIGANRYSGEVARAVSQDEFLSFAQDDQFQLVLAGDPYVTTEAIYVTLSEDGTITGDATGTWKMYGDNYIKLEIDGYDTYYGNVSITWLDNKNCVGSTVTAMGQTTGYPLYMNSETNN